MSTLKTLAISLLAVTLTLISTIVYGQIKESPVKWSVSSTHIEGSDYKLIFKAQIASPWHMYDMGPYDEYGPNATIFTINKSDSYTVIGKTQSQVPPTKIHDKTFDMEIGYFAGNATFTQKVKLLTTKAVVSGTIEYMVCDDQSCLPPEEYDFSVELKNTAAVAETTAETIATAEEATTEIVATETAAEAAATKQTAAEQTAADNPDKSLWATIIEAILWGFAALLTPCVFPMVPMTVSFFMKSEGNAARGRFMAFMYGLFIVALYTIPIAIIILVTRVVGGDAVTADIFNWLATHWIPNVIFFLVFMIFAASFFGAFEITMPSWLVNSSDSKASKGGLGGLFFMAITLVLVSFSCTGPIVGSVLIKSTAGEFWDPIITMFAFSSAFALPFVVFALFPSLLKGLPKSGGWLNSVKVVLGFIEVALGLKFLSVADQTYHWGLLDREIYLAIWIVVFSLLGIYLLGKLKFAHDSDVKNITVTRLFLSIGVFSFVVYLVPGMFGAPLKGISGYLPPMHTQDFTLGANVGVNANNNSNNTVSDTGKPAIKFSDFLSLPHGLEGFFDFDQAATYAREVRKPLLVDFTGHGCVNCREMESRVWSDPEVLKLMRNDYVIVALYSDDKKQLPESDWVTTDSGKVLKSLGKINSYFARTRFGINAQPYYMILNDEGKQIVPARGYDLDVAAFVEFLKNGVKAYNNGNE